MLVTHPSAVKGNEAERAVVDYLRGLGYDVQRALKGSNRDCGDIVGIPGVVIQVKNQKVMQLGVWMNDVRQQMANANARFGILVVKRRGKSNPKDWYWIFEGDGHAAALAGLATQVWVDEQRRLVDEGFFREEEG